MSILDSYECEGQMSMFDIYGQDFLFGKTYQEPSVPTKGKTLDAYSKKFAELRIKMPQYLCLKKGNGVQAVASWGMDIQWLGEYMTRSFGEYPSEERESRLSQILQENVHPKYYLSARACQGILNRAERRGKELPPLLRETLLRQSHSKNEQDVMGGAKGYSYNITESEPYQPSTISQSWDGSQTSPTLTANNAGGGQRMPDKDNFNAVITYGLDRASFNQGKNAKYDFSIEEDLAQPGLAKGWGGY